MLSLRSSSVFSVKVISTAIVFMGIFLGYQEKILGFSSVVVGFSLIAQSSKVDQVKEL